MLCQISADHLSVTVPSQDMNLRLTGSRGKGVGGEAGRGVQLGALTAVAPQKLNKYFHYPIHRNQPFDRVFYEKIARFSQK